MEFLKKLWMITGIRAMFLRQKEGANPLFTWLATADLIIVKAFSTKTEFISMISPFLRSSFWSCWSWTRRWLWSSRMFSSFFKAWRSCWCTLMSIFWDSSWLKNSSMAWKRWRGQSKEQIRLKRQEEELAFEIAFAFNKMLH